MFIEHVLEVYVLSKFFAETWVTWPQHLKLGRSAEEVIKRRSTWSKYYLINPFSCIQYSFQVSGWPSRVIVTLDPNKFAKKKQQCLHIGNKSLIKPRISLPKQSTNFVRDPSLFYDCNVIKKGTTEKMRNIDLPRHKNRSVPPQRDV